MDLLAFVMALQAEGKTAEEVRTAVNQYLEDNPDAIDQAAIEAILDGRLDDIEDDVGDLKSALNELAENGYYTTIPSDAIYIPLSIGAIRSDGTINPNSGATRAYTILTQAQMSKTLEIDGNTYNYSVCYYNGESVERYTAWLSASPIVFDNSVQHDSIGLTIKRIDNAGMPENERLFILHYYTDSLKIGQLATKDYVDNFKPHGLKMIYPDGFTSRIKPDIFYNGRYYADINVEDYKLAGSGEVWVSTGGNDTSGDGSENNPYLTLIKALFTTAKTIHIKSGTYEQGVHYAGNTDLANKNIIGHGTVIFQHNSSGGYVYATGSAFIENINFKHSGTGGNAAFVATCTTSGEVICFCNCTFQNAGGNGLELTGIDAVLYNCMAFGNKSDGFNYHAITVSNVTYTPNVIEIDCISYNNGTNAGSSCNGSTSHDGVKIIRLNGEYYACHGGAVAEIGQDGGDTTISVNYGVLSHDSTGLDGYKASFWASTNTEMYLYNCQSYGGDYDISAINDAKVVSWRLTTGRDNPSVNVASTATVIQH